MIRTEAYKKHLEEIEKKNKVEIVSPLLSNKKKKEVATMSVKSVSKKEAKKKEEFCIRREMSEVLKGGYKK